MSDFTCENCKNFKGNCGKHFIDKYNHIDYTCPSESQYDNCCGNIPLCFQPTEAYLLVQKKKIISNIAKSYSIDELEEALKLIKETKQ